MLESDLKKKRRFCWDEGLHFRFLEFAFRYGIESADRCGWVIL